MTIMRDGIEGVLLVPTLEVKEPTLRVQRLAAESNTSGYIL